LVEKFGMVIFTLKDPHKASMAERFIQTLKGRIERYLTENKTKRWIDVLQNISLALNNSVNKSTGNYTISF
jgi:hypothetical protein